jgi:hypothetical protein
MYPVIHTPHALARHYPKKKNSKGMANIYHCMHNVKTEKLFASFYPHGVGSSDTNPRFLVFPRDAHPILGSWMAQQALQSRTYNGRSGVSDCGSAAAFANSKLRGWMDSDEERHWIAFWLKDRNINEVAISTLSGLENTVCASKFEQL